MLRLGLVRRNVPLIALKIKFHFTCFMHNKASKVFLQAQTCHLKSSILEVCSEYVKCTNLSIREIEVSLFPSLHND